MKGATPLQGALTLRFTAAWVALYLLGCLYDQ
jgi:hypothetical protein